MSGSESRGGAQPEHGAAATALGPTLFCLFPHEGQAYLARCCAVLPSPPGLEDPPTPCIGGIPTDHGPEAGGGQPR